MTVDPENCRHPVTAFALRRIPTPIKFVPEDRKEEYERALAPLTPRRRRIVMDGVVDIWREQYINPVVGEKFIGFIEAKLEKGEYDEFTDSQKFANQLSLDAVIFDKHALVIFREPHPPEEPSRKKTNAKETNDGPDEKNKCAEMYDRFKKANFAFDEPLVERIGTKRLGILSMEGFVPIDVPPNRTNCLEIIEAISSVVSQIAGTDALIIDLRSNTGGSPFTVALVESYLLGDGEDDTIHLFDELFRNGTIHSSIDTVPASKLPSHSARFGSSKPLFLLTSKKTVSAGEMFAYNLQVCKRACAVISWDRTTMGAGNGGGSGPRFVAEEEFGKEWWVVLAPDVTMKFSITGTGWEGVGVVTDNLVGKDEGVMHVARRMAKEALGLD